MLYTTLWLEQLKSWNGRIQFFKLLLITIPSRCLVRMLLNATKIMARNYASTIIATLLLFHANLAKSQLNCAQQDCEQCLSWSSECLVCANFKFLHQGSCYSNCDSFPGYHEVGSARYFEIMMHQFRRDVKLDFLISNYF